MANFSGVETVKTSQGGVFFLPGVYVVQLEVVKEATSRKEVDFIAIECKILASDNPDRRVGSSMSQLYMCNKDSWLGNFKAFLAVASDCDESEVDEAGCVAAVSEENPLEGTILRAEAVLIKTKAGNDFTKVTWKKATDVDQALAKKLSA